LAQCDAALALLPDDAVLNNTRGVALAGLFRMDDAEAAFRRALALDDSQADAHVNLGNALADRLDSATAIGHFERALQLGPPCPDTLANSGHALRQLGRLDDATAAYDRAIGLDPANSEANFGNAVAHLTRGRYRRGWEHYRFRDSMRAAPSGLCRTPLEDDLSGRRIVVVPDQGIGDELFFLRFAAALRARGAWLGYRPDARLAAMLTRAGIVDAVVAPDETPEAIDLTLSVGDLPYLLGMADDDAPPSSIAVPPLAEHTAALRDRLAALGPPPYVGVTWRAGTRGRRRLLDKEAPLVDLAAALAPVEATIIAIQRNPDDGEIETLAEVVGRPVHDLTGLNDDLEAMLALVALLDDYVAVSNTNVHLRAAVGRTSRVLVPSPSEFRWMAADAESPWFPGSPVYRQATDGSWGAALAALGAQLCAHPAAM
jgi:hypothetical protein